MWKDVTSYSRDDKERKPTTFEAKSGALRIVITCGHIHYPGQWVMHCHKIGIDTMPLRGCESLEEAKLRAISIVRSDVSRLAEDAQRFGV